MRPIREILACIRAIPQWIPVTLDYVGIRHLTYPYHLTLRNGDTLILREHTDTIIFWLIFARQHYPVAPSSRVVLDIGANIGIFTLYAARKAPQARIIAVEPFPDTFERLGDLVAVNRLGDRVISVNCAIASKAGDQTMDSAANIPSQYRRIHAPETASLNVSHRGPAALAPDENGVPIRTETLETVLDRVGVSAVDFVKMNIHGSEYDVLLSTPSGVLRRCRRIAVQYHELPAEMNLGKEQIFERLRSLGFTLLQDDDTHRGAGRAILALSGA